MVDKMDISILGVKKAAKFSENEVAVRFLLVSNSMVFIETPSVRCQDTIFYIQQAVQLNTCTKHVRYGPYNYLTGQFFGWVRGVQTRIRRPGKEGNVSSSRMKGRKKI